MKKLPFAFVFLALLAPVVSLRADITMHIDTTGDIFWFSGSDTGTLQPFIIGQYTGWTAGANGYPATQLDLSPAFTASTTTGDIGQFFSYSGGLEITLITLAGGSDCTFTADPARTFNYSAFDPSNKDFLESLIGQSLTNASPGSGFGAMQVAIPEPSTYALFAGVGVFAFAAFRRWRKQ